MRRLIYAALAFTLSATTVAAEVGPAQVYRTSFSDCLKRIRVMATRTATAPVNIMETDSIRMVRFPVSDGSILITCTDGKMTVGKSSRKCGVDVKC